MGHFESFYDFFWTFFGKRMLFVELAYFRCGCSLDVFLEVEPWGLVLGRSDLGIFYPSHVWPGGGR